MGAVVTASRRATIGIVMPLGSQLGGAEALLQHLLRQGSAQYLYACAFLEDGPLVGLARELGYATAVVPTTHLSHAGNYLQTVWSLRQWIKANRLDVVVSWMPKAQLYTSPAARFLGVRAVWFQHGVPHGDRIDRIATWLPAVAVLCCSESSRTCQNGVFPVRRSHVCYPGVAVSTEQARSRAEAREMLGLPPIAPVIGMVARLEHWKGAHVFVEAATEILKHYPEARLFIVGGPHALDPAYAEKIYAMVAEMNVGNRFLLAGQRPMAEVSLWQGAADVIVHPVVGVEPFGMSVVEAMALGRVVVASNLGGPAEIIEDGVSGILIDRERPDLLASTVIALLEDPLRRIVIERQAQLRAQTFSAEIFAARFQQLMAEVLAA